jgi:pimeloyl-ACP methyl ester carboxylesterase
MKRKLILFLFFVVFSDLSLSDELCTLSGWNKHEVSVEIEDDNEANGFRSETIILHSYRRWPSYLPGYTLDPQVIVLNGGIGAVDCDSTVMYNNIGSKASYNWRQAITLDLNYWENGRNTVEKAATYVVDILNQLVEAGYLKSSFYLMGGSAGTAIISAALDHHPSFMNRVDRAIFVSGPFTDISQGNIYNTDILGIMTNYSIAELVSLKNGMVYDPTRYNQWIKPIMDKNGLRFYVAEDDDVFCRDFSDLTTDSTPPECPTGTMYDEFLNWVHDATDGTENRASLENLGVLWVYQQGGHDLMETHPELLNSAFEP